MKEKHTCLMQEMVLLRSSSLQAGQRTQNDRSNAEKMDPQDAEAGSSMVPEGSFERTFNVMVLTSDVLALTHSLGCIPTTWELNGY